MASADGMRFMIPVSTIHAFSRPAALTVGAAPLGKHFIRRYTKGEEALDIDALARLERVRLLHLDVDCTSLRADIRSPEGRVVAADRGWGASTPARSGTGAATSRRPQLNLDPLARHRLWTPARGVRPSRPTLRQPISRRHRATPSGRLTRHALVTNTDRHRYASGPLDAAAHASGVMSTKSCTRRANVSTRGPIRHISCNLSSVVAWKYSRIRVAPYIVSHHECGRSGLLRGLTRWRPALACDSSGSQSLKGHRHDYRTRRR